MLSEAIMGFMIDSILSIFMIPLAWLPDGIVDSLKVCIFVFGIVLVGRLLKWLWDALPLA